MKIFLPSIMAKHGGPKTFMAQLTGFLERQQAEIVKSPYRASVLCFPVAYNIEALRLARRCGVGIVQRLDGIYYPSQHGEEYESFNRPIQVIYNELADFVIFQSEYSRAQCFHMFGPISEDKYRVIYNGSDLSCFYPSDQNFAYGQRVKFISTGVFRKKGMIEPLTQSLDGLVGSFEFELHLVGEITLDEIWPYLERDYIIYHGPKAKSEVAMLLRQAHIYLHSQVNDNCPNAVIEAVSTGLPVVGFKGGALPELCHFALDLQADVSQVVFQQYSDFDPSALREKIRLAVNNYSDYRNVFLEHCKDYDFERTGAAYLHVFEKVAEGVRPCLVTIVSVLRCFVIESKIKIARWYGKAYYALSGGTRRRSKV